MVIMIVGLVVFLGVHSVRIFADDWRTSQLARMGEGKWKGLYTLLSVIGLALIVYGYGQTRQSPVDIWSPPVWTRHIAVLLTVVAFVLISAAYVARTHIKAAVGHPMVLGVKVWALAHLLANGRLGDIVLFGSFLVWAVLNYRAARKRDRVGGVHYPTGTIGRDIVAIVVGLVISAVFIFWLHGLLFGVRPLG